MVDDTIQATEMIYYNVRYESTPPRESRAEADSDPARPGPARPGRALEPREDGRLGFTPYQGESIPCFIIYI